MPARRPGAWRIVPVPGAPYDKSACFSVGEAFRKSLTIGTMISSFSIDVTCVVFGRMASRDCESWSHVAKNLVAFQAEHFRYVIEPHAIGIAVNEEHHGVDVPSERTISISAFKASVAVKIPRKRPSASVTITLPTFFSDMA